MRIIHLSDLHIADSGMPIWDTDTTFHFEKAIQLIGKIPSVDAIFMSGDIADKGSVWAYEYVKYNIEKLKIHTYISPGNHDNIKIFKSVLTSEYCHCDAICEIDAWKFIFLNSVITNPDDEFSNMGRGNLSSKEINLLKNELSSPSNIGVILHHPPIEPEGWLNRKILDNREDFRNLIEQSGNVRFVLYGHTHYHSIDIINSIQYICAPSIGFAFNKDLPKFQIDKGAEGFLIIDINNQKIHCKRVQINE